MDTMKKFLDEIMKSTNKYATVKGIPAFFTAVGFFVSTVTAVITVKSKGESGIVYYATLMTLLVTMCVLQSFVVIFILLVACVSYDKHKEALRWMNNILSALAYLLIIFQAIVAVFDDSEILLTKKPN